jgi:hypothetical protein
VAPPPSRRKIGVDCASADPVAKSVKQRNKNKMDWVRNFEKIFIWANPSIDGQHLSRRPLVSIFAACDQEENDSRSAQIY